MEMKFLPDEPINSKDGDLLGFNEFVDLIKSSVSNTETPFVYGVLGDWGVGKTSVLQSLKSCMSSDLDSKVGNLVPIWFNAWKYENEANIIYPLLYALKSDFTRRFKGAEARDNFFKIFQQVSIASIAILADFGLRVVTSQIGNEAISLDDVSQQVKTVREEQSVRNIEGALNGWADNVSTINEAFSELLDVYAEYIQNEIGIKKKDVTFVFIIDDLDRCLPETTIAVLEGIKNYLSVNRCVFLLGLNPKVIYQGIKIKYKGLDIDGREYLEKILNYSFCVPEPKPSKISEFVDDGFRKLLLNSGDYETYESLFQEFGKVLEKCRFDNPRKIKRILNRYLFFLSAYESSLQKVHNENTVRFIVLAEYFPNLFRLFSTSEEQTRVVQSLLIKIGGDQFDISSFENRYGVSLSPSYAQLSRMSNIFDLNLGSSNNRLTITEHSVMVSRISRLI